MDRRKDNYGVVYGQSQRASMTLISMRHKPHYTCKVTALPQFDLSPDLDIILLVDLTASGQIAVSSKAFTGR